MNKFKPYVGLRPYRDDENLIFFGREEQTLELLQRLHHNRFVAVVGTSGCGKSSMLRAGLIPALKGGFLVEESDTWCIAKMKPGGRPMFNLAYKIIEQVKLLSPKSEVVSPKEFVEQIQDDGVDAILDLIRPLRKSKYINFFLLIDQFEELFDFAKKEPLAANKNEATGLVNLMLDLAEQTEIPFYVVMTMRSDFIGDCAEYYRLPEALNESQYLVPRLTRSQLRKVIEGPARISGLHFDPALTSKLLNESAKDQDELPVLQHALLRMWQNEIKKENSDGQIDFKDYEAIGELSQALSQDANAAFKDLKVPGKIFKIDDEKTWSKDQKLARKIFKTLTTVDENGRKIRKRTKLKDLIAICDATESDVDRVMDVFIKKDRSFIIYDPAKGLEQIIDISHESLIRQWTELKKWVNEESENVGFYTDLVNARKEYENKKRNLLDSITLKRIKKKNEKFIPTEVWAKEIDDDFESTKAFVNKSKRRLKLNRTLLWSFISAVIITLSILSYKFHDSSTQNKELTIVIESEVSNLIEQGDDEFLARYAELMRGKKSIFLPQLLKHRYDKLFTQAIAINKIETYEEYISKSIDTVNNNDTIYYKEADLYRQIVLENLDSLKLKATDNTEDHIKLVKAINEGFNSVLQFYMDENITDINLKEKSLIAIKENENIKKGWLYAGRKNSNGTRVNDRLFNLIYKPSSPAISQDAMLEPDDVVVLRGGVHRRLYYESASRRPINGEFAKNDILYFVKSVDIQGSAIFLEIYYEKENIVADLVKSIDSDVKSIRSNSLNELIRDYNSNGKAVDSILALFDDNVIDVLSAQGRVNAIVFLYRTTNEVWTKERKAKALTVISKLEERHEKDIASLGPQTRGHINRLKEHLSKIK